MRQKMVDVIVGGLLFAFIVVAVTWPLWVGALLILFGWWLFT